MKATTAMTRDVVCITPDDSIADAYDMMTEWEIRHLPVLQGAELVGILSDRDVLRFATPDDAAGIVVPNVPVRKAMTPHPMTCAPTTSLAEIGSLMLEHKIDSVPVVETDGSLAGLVTSSDLLTILVGREQVAMTKPIPFVFRVQRAARPGARVTIATKLCCGGC